MEKLSILCLFFKLLLRICLASSKQSLAVLILPEGPLEVLVGTDISLNCTINSASTKSALRWHPPHMFAERERYRYNEEWKAPNVLVLTIKSAQLVDSGMFMCSSKEYGESYVKLSVFDPQKNNPKTCTTMQYRCPDGMCIFQRYRCDKVMDCSDGADELDCDFSCSEDEWKCENGQCINKDYFCDRFGSYDCRDESDEKHCGKIQYGIDAEDNEQDIQPKHHGWHFNAIYSGIASIIGVACIGAIIVITLCRIHMRREAMRQGSRYQNYLDHRDMINDPSRPYPWLRRTPQQQILNNSSAPYHRSEDSDLDLVPYRCQGQTNLNVNINLRLTDQGEPELANTLITKPPSYSELANVDPPPPQPPPREGTPPPPYSTLPLSHISNNMGQSPGVGDDEAVPPYELIPSTERLGTGAAVPPCERIPSTERLGTGAAVQPCGHTPSTTEKFSSTGASAVPIVTESNTTSADRLSSEPVSSSGVGLTDSSTQGNTGETALQRQPLLGDSISNH